MKPFRKSEKEVTERTLFLSICFHEIQAFNQHEKKIELV